MTQTTTDYLYALPSQVQDRSFAASTTDAGGSFDDHLSEASSSAGEKSPASSNFRQQSSTPNSTEAPNQSSYADESSRPAEPVSKADPEKTSGGKLQSAPSRTTEHPTGDEHEKREETEKDTEKRDHSIATQVAASAHLAVQIEAKSQKSGSPNAQVTTDAIYIRPEPSNQQTSTERESTTAVNKAQLQSSHLDGETDRQPGDAALEDPAHNQPEKKSSTAKQTKTQDSKQSGSRQNEPAENETSQNTLPRPAIDREGAAEAVQNSNPIASVSVKDLKTKAETASDAHGGDDSAHNSDKDGKARSTTSAADHTSKLDAAQIGNAPAVSPKESLTGTPAKSNKNEQVVKPVAGTNESAAASFARLARAGGGIGRENGPKGADDLPQIDPTRFVGRVTKAFQTAQERGGSLQIRLSPPELGALRLELTVKDGVMSASLQTESSSARRLLLDHLPTLRDRLAEQNIHVDRFDVDVRRDGSGSQADARGSQHQHFHHQPDQPAPRRQYASQQVHEPAVPETIDAAKNISDLGLNLII